MSRRLFSLVLLALASACAATSSGSAERPSSFEQRASEPFEGDAELDRELAPDASPEHAEFQDAETRDRIARMEGYFPDPLLSTDRNEKVRFYEDLVRGKCVLIQFLYTDCDGT